MKLLIDCDCGADILKVEKIDEDSIWFCIYKSRRMGLWDRVKASWHYFWHGEFFNNDISLNEKQIDELTNFFHSSEG